VQINYGKIKHYRKQARVLDFEVGVLEASQVLNLDIRRNF